MIAGIHPLSFIIHHPFLFMFRSLPTRLLYSLLIGLAAVVVVPLLWLSLYNHASPADDYCFADTVRTYGFWQAQHYYYHGWSGRYFHNFIVHASPLSMGWLGGYKFLAPVMLLILALTFRQLGRVLSAATGQPGRGFGVWAFVAAALLVIITMLPSVAEFFFWLPGIAIYSSAYAMLILWLIRVYRRDQGQTPATVGGFLPDCLLIAALVGTGETSIVALLSWLALITVGKWLQTRTIPGYLGVYWTVALVCCGFAMLAPGNFIRMATGPKERDLTGMLVQSGTYTLRFLAYRLTHSPLLPLSVLFLPIAYRLTAPDSRFRPYATLPLGLIVSQAIATAWALVFLHYWAVGIEPAPRVQNLVICLFTLSWFLGLIVLVRLLRPAFDRFPRLATQPVLLGVVAVGLVFTVWRNEVLRLMAGDLTSGRARQYSAAMDARYRQMTRPGSDTLTMAPLPASPVSLVLEDIRPDPRHLWNKCWASYYHQKAVVLENGQ